MDIKETNRQVIKQFRSGGQIEGMHRDRLLLLTTIGARTGERRTTPMMFHRDGGRILVIASNMGAPAHPDWYRNLVAHPEVTVEVGDETYEAEATPLTGEERERLWAMLKKKYPFFIDHEARTIRAIPVVALTPRDLRHVDVEKNLRGPRDLRHNGVVKTVGTSSPGAVQRDAGSAVLPGKAMTPGNATTPENARTKALPGGGCYDGAAGSRSERGTRGQVARLILELGPSTAATLGGRLGLTPAAIRRHLDNLIAEGLIETRTARTYGNRGRGRPAKLFVITDAGRSAFEHAYDDLATSALRFLAETAGPRAVAEFARRQVADLERRYTPAVAQGELADRVQALAEALSADGYAASAGPAPAVGSAPGAPGAAGEQICQHHCPVAHVAAEFPQLCEAETEAFGRLLGTPVQRLATIAHGDGICTTHVTGHITGKAKPPGKPKLAEEVEAPGEANTTESGGLFI